MDRRNFCGGILWLLELAESHPSEIRADFRSRYNISWDDVGSTVSWLEALHLVNMLIRDPSSWVQASKNGWKYPVSNEWMLLAELFDLTHQVNSKNKVKPLVRPWPDPNSKRVGNAKHSRADILRNLDRMNKKES